MAQNRMRAAPGIKAAHAPPLTRGERPQEKPPGESPGVSKATIIHMQVISLGARPL